MVDEDTRTKRTNKRAPRQKKQPLDTRPIGERAASFFHRDSHVEEESEQTALHRELREESASTLFSD